MLYNEEFQYTGCPKKGSQLEYLDNYLVDFLENLHIYLAAQNRRWVDTDNLYTITQRNGRNLWGKMLK